MKRTWQIQKNTRDVGESIKTWSPVFARYGQPWTQKKGPKTTIFPNALFLHFSLDLPTFPAESPILNAQKRLFGPEVLFQRSQPAKHHVDMAGLVGLAGLISLAGFVELTGLAGFSCSASSAGVVGFAGLQGFYIARAEGAGGPKLTKPRTPTKSIQNPENPPNRSLRTHQTGGFGVVFWVWWVSGFHGFGGFRGFGGCVKFVWVWGFGGFDRFGGLAGLGRERGEGWKRKEGERVWRVWWKPMKPANPTKNIRQTQANVTTPPKSPGQASQRSLLKIFCSVNSSNHSSRSRNGLPCALPMSSFLLWRRIISH